MKVELLFDGTDANNPRLYSWSKKTYLSVDEYITEAHTSASEEIAKFPGNGFYSREYNLALAACKVLQNVISKHVYFSMALPVQMGISPMDMPEWYALYKRIVSHFCRRLNAAARIMEAVLVEEGHAFPPENNHLRVLLVAPNDSYGPPNSRLAHMRAVVALLRGENRVQTTEA